VVNFGRGAECSSSSAARPCPFGSTPRAELNYNAEANGGKLSGLLRPLIVAVENAVPREVGSAIRWAARKYREEQLTTTPARKPQKTRIDR
jgi:hypothetical protein